MGLEAEGPASLSAARYTIGLSTTTYLQDSGLCLSWRACIVADLGISAMYQTSTLQKATRRTKCGGRDVRGEPVRSLME